MIKYNLNCKKCKKLFDSWFASSYEFEKLKKNKYLSCPFCNSINIQKSLMSPNVLKKYNNEKKSDDILNFIYLSLIKRKVSN